MEKHSVLQALYMSFYSRNLYKDVGEKWGGKAFLYLLIVLALSWIGQVIMIQTALNRMFAQSTDEFIAGLPIVTIKDGNIITPENRPYLIKDPKSEKVFAIIDTSGKYNNLTQSKTEILITKTKIYEQRNKHEVRIHDLPSDLNLTINANTISGYVKRIIGFAWIFIFAFLLIASYIYRILQTLIYSMIGRIYSSVSGANVSFGTIIPITMVALTPVILLSTILDLLAVSFPHQNLSYFIIAIGYMIFGIRANKQ